MDPIYPKAWNPSGHSYHSIHEWENSPQVTAQEPRRIRGAAGMEAWVARRAGAWSWRGAGHGRRRPPTQVMGFGDFESRIQDWGPSFQFRDFSGNIWRKLGPPDMRFFSSSSFSRHTFGLGFCHRYFQVAAALAWWCKAGFQTRSKSMCNFYMVEDASNFEYSLHAKSIIVLAFVL